MYAQMTLAAAATLLALTVAARAASGASYYVRPDGSDGADGLSETAALRTLTEAANRTREGDRVLLKRGGVFRESAVFEAGRLRIDAYGRPEAPRPVVSGSVEVSDWQLHEGAIYVAETEEDIGYLFVNGHLMTMARYPNEGWLRTKVWRELNPVQKASGVGRMGREGAGGGPTLVECPELAEHPRNADGYWVGATIRWRHHSWWYETRPIIEYEAGGKLTLGDVSDWASGPFDWDEEGWGFYVDGKLEELDAPGEWHFDGESGKVYLWPSGNADPNELLVEASCLSRGLRVHDSIVKNICFRHQRDVGLEMDGTCLVEGCRFEGIGRDAPPSEFDAGGAALKAGRGTRNAQVVHNEFHNNFNLGITWREAPVAGSSSVIEHNELTDTGMVAGYGGSGLWHAVPIRIVSGSGLHVRHNRIERSGYSGILFLADDNYAERNVVEGAVATTNDGAGIMTCASRTTIRGNIVLDCRGEMESSGTWKNLAQGIWLDCYPEDNRDQVVEGNTVARCGQAGLFVRDNHDCLIRDNTLYANRNQITITGSGHRVLRNVFCAAAEGQRAIYYVSDDSPGIMRGNYLWAPAGVAPLEKKEGPALSLERWQQECEWADPAAAAPPADAQPELFINDGARTKTIPLEGEYRSVDGGPVPDKIELDPFEGCVLFRLTEH